MQINKKLLSTAVAALLLVSMLAAAAPAFAAPNTIIFKNADGITVDEANVGQVLTISGTGATALSQVKIYWRNTDPANLLNTTYAGITGDDTGFSCNITVPLAKQGDYTVVVQDNSGAIGTATLTVKPKITAALIALPGDQVTVSGTGFAASEDITLDFNGEDVTPTGLTTNASGAFSAVFTVPSGTALHPTTAKVLTAKDQTGNSATANIIVSYYVTVTPDAAYYQPGMTVTVSGRVETDKAVTVTFGGSGISTITAFTTTSDSTGYFSGKYQLPSVLTLGGGYTFTATWTTGSADKTITINANAPEITSFKNQAGVVVTSGVSNAMLVISGQYFTPKSTVTISFAGTTLNTTTTNNAGAFACNITIPEVATGAYTVTVQDQYGVTATKTFTVVAAPVTNIAIGSNSYVQGDTISFTIYSTETVFTDISLAIRDPSGNLFWAITGLTVTTLPDSSKIVLYQDQVDNNGNHLTLPSDAAVGTWNWTITYISTTQPAPNGGRVTNLFTVGQGGTGGIMDAINELKGTIETIKGDVVTIKTSVGTSLTTTVSAIQAKVTSIEAGMATISAPNLGSITTSLSNIDAVLGVVAGDTATLKTSLGDVTTSLSAINAKVVSIEGDVASFEGKLVTIQTDVGTLQGVVTQVKDNVATISTGIGNVQASVSNLQASVSNLQPDVVAAKDNSASISTMVYVAVAFAVIAAIAAVASILLMRKKIAS